MCPSPSKALSKVTSMGHVGELCFRGSQTAQIGLSSFPAWTPPPACTQDGLSSVLLNACLGQ